MKDAIEEIAETCEKIRKLSELKSDYPENVVKKLEEEYKLKIKEIASKIELDFSFLNDELAKIEREIEIIKRDLQDFENSLKGLEIRYLIGEIKEAEREKKSKFIQKEIDKLKEKEINLQNEKEKIERIIKGGYEVAKEESRIFKVSIEEVPTPKEVMEVEEEKKEEIAQFQPEFSIEERAEEKVIPEEIKEEKSESAFEIPPFSFGEEKKEEFKEEKVQEEIEEKKEPEKSVSEEKFEFSPMETIGYTPEKKEPEEKEAEGKTAYVAVPYLIIRTTGGERRFLLTEGKNTVGRSPDCNIVINEKGVSREHFAVHVKGETITIEDLGSKNGTFVNGKRIKSVELKNGDEIIAGECSLIFEYG